MHARGPRPDGGIAVGTLILFNGEIGSGVPRRPADPCDLCNMHTVRRPQSGARPEPDRGRARRHTPDVALTAGTA
ncbi:hypothetical protein GCM10010245_78060 [Streptomyces spectabilis]|nr:hypothetical protein GCM10010245_78060 [Streptomyces spectabilis]